MTDTLVLRERFRIGERLFAVLGEPWFDPADAEWRGRVLYLPLDRSGARALSTGPVARAPRRDDLIARLGRLSDRRLRGAFRAVAAHADGQA